MAVVENLSVVLQAITGNFEHGLKRSVKELKGLEKQAAHSRRVLDNLRTSFKGFSGLGSKLSPLGIGPGGLTGLGLGFAAARFTTNSLKAFAGSDEGKELKSTMDGLNASVQQLEKSFGGWLATTVKFTPALKTLKAGVDAINPVVGVDVSDSISARIASVADNPIQATAEKALRENLKQQAAIQAQIRDTATRMGSAGFIGRAFAGVDATELLKLDRQLKDLRAEESALLPQAGFRSLQGGGLATREATLPLEGALQRMLKGPLNELPGAIDSAFAGLADLAANGVDQLNKLDSVFHKLEGDLHEHMKLFQASQGVINATINPLEQFATRTTELQNLFDRGFISDDVFNRALLDARQGLESFVGPALEAPGRVTGARRGSVEAFEKVAAFQDQKNSPVQRSLDELVSLTKEILRVDRDQAAKTRQQFDSLGTIDTKP